MLSEQLFMGVPLGQSAAQGSGNLQIPVSKYFILSKLQGCRLPHPGNARALLGVYLSLQSLFSFPS